MSRSLNPECLQLFRQITNQVISSWTALQLAVTNEFGGPESQHKADYLVSCLPDQVRSCKSEETLCTILEDYMDTEFQTECDDGSPYQVARSIMQAWELCKAGRLDDLRGKVTAMATVAADLNNCVALPCEEGVEEDDLSDDLTEEVENVEMEDE